MASIKVSNTVIKPLFCSILLSVLWSTSVFSGTICGNVLDSATGQPVAGAGVIVRDLGGTYTGHIGVTDDQGQFCIDGLTPGPYVVEVRVDDYLVAYLDNVIVDNAVSTVPIFAQIPPFRLNPPWPNPASGAVRFKVQVIEQMSLEIRIYDFRGRLVRGWSAGEMAPGIFHYRWDGADRLGRKVSAGHYLIQARAANHTISRRFLLVH